jgi:Tol biopolymer transport system component
MSPDIYVWPQGTPLTIGDDLYDHPTWSPDGNRIAFEWWAPGATHPDIWVMPSTGGPPFSRVTDAGGWNPAWSPDCGRVAFGREGNIWVIDSPVPVEPSTWGAIKRAFE